ncbi:MAG: AMP-binding protein, partial [Armatimonadetes bacterium]|nr:AMP-binding protein [Armatimonadota bacterium]
MAVDVKAIEALLDEKRTFPPDPGFTARAHARDPALYERAAADPDGFWAAFADELRWYRKWDQVLDWSNPPFARWFVNGQINACDNCLDRHIGTPYQNNVAIHWEGEPGDGRSLTYRQLWWEVCRFANVLKDLGVRKGDRVSIYMPMVPELPIAMLACARIGAPHSVVFGGFSAESLADRIHDSQSRILITADGGYRRGGVVALKATADAALENCASIEKVIVLKRTGQDVPMQPGRDLWWHDLVASASADCPPEPMDSEDLLYLLYTSGSTGKPKAIAHTIGGYLVGCYATAKWVFDLKDEDIFWCTADIGWVTGHSYVVYGPLALGATQVMYEGAPDWPERDRFWAICEKYGVTVFYTAPTAIRAFMKWGPEYPARRNLSTLRLLGTVGEPINPEAWMWYH